MKRDQDIKKILKRNELGQALEAGAGLLQRQRKPIFGLLVAALLLGLGWLGYKFYRIHQIDAFNQKLFEAEQGLNKEQNLTALIREFSGLPAHFVARFELADYYVENQKPAEAIQTLDDGLAHVSEPDILSTLAVLKIVEIRRAQKQYNEAAVFLIQKMGKVLPTYRPYLKMTQADLYVLAGQDSQARLLYMEVAQDPKTLPEGGEKWEFDPFLIKQAKDRLLSLELK